MAVWQPPFVGRAKECHALDRLVDGLRRGESAALVIRGEAGIGKTALLHYCAGQATACRVERIAGVEAELELPFAALHQLCAPLLSNLSTLPEPQRRALQVAFGLATGSPPDQFIVGLAVLSLLAESAATRPLVCLIDDAQWIDPASSQVLGFVARRLLAESVLLLFAARETDDEQLLPDLADLTLEGLASSEAEALLAASTSDQLDDRVRDRMVAETRGNPLALLELPKTMSRAELAGGFILPATAKVVARRVEESYLRRIEVLPQSTRQLMLVAAADPTGDATLLWRAAQSLDIPRDAAAAAASDHLMHIGDRVQFRHPLVRSAAYAAATRAERNAAHLALAAATNPESDMEHRVWHLAAAAVEPDEEIAAELERLATNAQARAGLAAAAAFLQRAVALTSDPSRRADRALAAVETYLHAGAFDTALSLIPGAEVDAIDDLQRARAEQLKGQLQWAANPRREAPILLLEAARRLQPLNAALARETYLHAWHASSVAGPTVHPDGNLVAVSKAGRCAVTDSRDARACDLLLDGLSTVIIDGRPEAESSLRRVVDRFLRDDVSAEDWLAWGILAQIATMALWDFDAWVMVSTRHVDLARASGALSALCIALSGRVSVATYSGDFALATSLGAENDTVKEVTGIASLVTKDLVLAAYRGRSDEASPLLATTVTESIATGQGLAVHMAQFATAILNNGLARYEEAFSAAQSAADEAYQPMGVQIVLPELIEAAVRTGRTAPAEDAMSRLTTMTIRSRSDWGKGLEARSRALVSDGADAEYWYAEAVTRLARTPLRPDLARAHLLYGEWLRRENRRVEARQQLRKGYDLFVAIGAEAFAERARRELVATGEKVRKRSVDTRNNLTAQEAHIARLARDGRSNSEIGSELFLSVRTVEWHLRKVFAKLGVASRRELESALPTTEGAG